MAAKRKRKVMEFEQLVSCLPLPLVLKGRVKGKEVRIPQSGNVVLFAEDLEYLGEGTVKGCEVHFYRRSCRKLTNLPPITPDTLLIVDHLTFDALLRCRPDLRGMVATPFNPEIKYDDNGKNPVIEATGLIF